MIRGFRRGLSLLACCVLLTAVSFVPAYAAPDPVNVTVTIIRIVSIENPDITDTAADFYSRVRIDGFGFEDTEDEHQDDESDVSPYWRFTKTVDSSLGTIPIEIQIWDHDFDTDDVSDVNPVDGVQGLVLLFDLASGTWSGDVPANTGFSQGDGDVGLVDEGGEATAVLFDISLGNGDIDGDGIPDGVERFGVLDQNGIVVANMAVLGADPCRKTVAVEVDFMAGAADGHTHQPQLAAIAEAVTAFNAAPVPAVSACPYAGFPTEADGLGVNLVVDVDDAIPEFSAINDFGTVFDAIKASAFEPERLPYFHYSLWIHNRTGTSSSGVCCEGKDFIVSLGSFANQVGTVRQQSGTFIHELGHDLGLGHGGGDGINCKPNYLSVMSYAFQVVGISNANTGVALIDYSTTALPLLNESALVESAGISNGPLITTWADDTGALRTGRGDGALDFDWDTPRTIDPAPVSVDINALPIGGCGQDNAGNPTPSPGETLAGFDDWSNLQYRAAMSPTAGGVNIIFDEITAEAAEDIEQFWLEAFSPDLHLTKSADASDAIPGDSLTYTVTTENVGTGEADNVQVVDTLPDGTTDTRPLADLRAGESSTETFTYLVPCSTPDLTVLANSATVAATNLRSNPEADTSNNTDEVSTIVHTPVLESSKTATSAVNAGEAITYEITYENTGTGNAEHVTITDTLPADVYYSSALDQGLGPAPDSVVGNPDGTTTLTWNVGMVSASSGPATIQYTARPSLLFLEGDSVANSVVLTFTNENDCVYPSVTSSAPTDITIVEPTQDPTGLGFWRNHPELWIQEILARIQATDDRFDGADGTAPDGQLSAAEVQTVLLPGGNMDKVLEEQLLATYFNLATRRINAGTAIESRTADELGLHNVREAVLYAMDTLVLPVTPANRARYSNATLVLDEINSNRSEVY